MEHKFTESFKYLNASKQLKEFSLEIKLCEKSSDKKSMLQKKWNKIWTMSHTYDPAVLFLMTDYLIKNGVDVRAPVQNGREALRFLPEMYGRAGESFKRIDHYFGKILKRMCDAGADINASINDRGNILFDLGYAVVGEKSVEKALQLGANPNSRGWQNETPMFRMSGPKKLELLLKAGADINAVKYGGQSALMMHIVTSYIQKGESIKFFIDNGANVESTDHRGRNVLSYAQEYCNPQELKIIEKAIQAKKQKIILPESDRTY